MKLKKLLDLFLWATAPASLFIMIWNLIDIRLKGSVTLVEPNIFILSIEIVWFLFGCMYWIFKIGRYYDEINK